MRYPGHINLASAREIYGGPLGSFGHGAIGERNAELCLESSNEGRSVTAETVGDPFGDQSGTRAVGRRPCRHATEPISEGVHFRWAAKARQTGERNNHRPRPTQE